jgi:hypothetical protein
VLISMRVGLDSLRKSEQLGEIHRILVSFLDVICKSIL